MPDTYASNRALYADPALTEGVDYARRWSAAGARTVVLAPHGGDIEPGTSELCLAIAGYDPASGQPCPDVDAGAGPLHDYWMFEGVRPDDNLALHVTSTHCDDDDAVALCASALNAVAVHGFNPARNGLAAGAQVVLVGGLDDELRRRLVREFQAAGIETGDDLPGLGGLSPENIVNRTSRGRGAQLEVSRALRTAMFSTPTRAVRKDTTTEVFRTFVSAVRAAVAEQEEAEQAQG